MQVNFLSLFLSILYFVGGLAIISLILYLLVRAVVRDELKKLHITENTMESRAQDQDKK